MRGWLGVIDVLLMRLTLAGLGFIGTVLKTAVKAANPIPHRDGLGCKLLMLDCRCRSIKCCSSVSDESRRR